MNNEDAIIDTNNDDGELNSRNLTLRGLLEILIPDSRFVVYDNDTGLHTDEMLGTDVVSETPAEGAILQLKTLLDKNIMEIEPDVSDGKPLLRVWVEED